jgi:hypothetical protein
MAQAAEEYARAEKLGDEAERSAREIRLRAARRAGQLLQQMEKRPGERSDLRQPVSIERTSSDSRKRLGPFGRTLVKAGISPAQATRWQRIAKVPEEEFEMAVRDGLGETALERTRKKTAIPNQPIHQSLPREHGKGGRGKEPTIRQSFRGLEQAAVQIQGLAEALEGQLFGDWSRLYELPEAAPLFDVIQENLPVVNARLKRILREREGHELKVRDAN